MTRSSIVVPVTLLFLLLMLEPDQAEAQCDGVDIQVDSKHQCVKLKDPFRDCPKCPELVVAPSGTFMMGSPKDEPQREPFNNGSEDQLAVTIDKSFAVGRFAVTRGEFAAFVTATGRKTEGGCIVYAASEWKLRPDRNWRSPGFSQTDRHPVVCVNWDDAKAYVAWLSSISGKTYRLLSDSEREYVARAGSTTPFWRGSAISTSQANYNGNTNGDGSNDDWRRRTVPVDSFTANAWGLFNVHGNVWDWTEDCWNASNAGNPGNGNARRTGDCSRRVLRGGSWGSHSQLLRSADRHWYLPSTRAFSCGFRVARTLE